MNESKPPYIGRRVYGCKGTEFEHIYGTVTGVRKCSEAGCPGTTLRIEWPDGLRILTCSQKCKQRDTGELEIHERTTTT
jgi:hypothetical protein